MKKLYFTLLLPSIFLCAQSVNYEQVLKDTLENNKKLKQEKQNILLNKSDINYINSINYGKLYLEEQIMNTNHSGHVFNSKLSSREASFTDFGFAQYTGNANIQPKDLNHPGSRTNFNTKIAYSLPLFTGFELTNQKDILKLKNKALELKLSLDKKQLSLEVLKAYNQAVVAKQFIKASKNAKVAISSLVKSAKAFHENGLVTKIDVKQALVYELNIKSKVLEAQNNFDLALAYLRFLSSNENISDVNELKNLELKEFSKTNALNHALIKRDEIKMQDLQIKAYEKNISLSKSSLYPQIGAHIEYGFNDDYLNLDTNKDYYLGMLNISYTLFDNTTKAKKQKAKILHQKAKLDKLYLKDAIKLQLEKAYLNLNSKKKVLKEKIEAKILASEVFEQSKLMYKNKLISMTNLLEQEANLRKYEAQEIMALYDLSMAKAKLALAVNYDFTKMIKKEKND